MRATTARRTAGATLGFSFRSLLLGLVVIATAMVGLALLAEAMSGDGGTVYLARVDAGGEAVTRGPSIVVAGSGRATTPADAAEVQILLSQTGDDMYDGGSGATTPSPASTPTADDLGMLAPVINAIAAEGVPAEQITAVVSPAFVSECFGPSPNCAAARIGFSLAEPTPDRLNAIVSAVSDAAATMGWMMMSAGVRYTAGTCGELPDLARTAAVEDARERASAQAAALGVELGALLTSSEESAIPVDDRGCPRLPVEPAAVDLFGLLGRVGLTTPAFDPDAPAEVVFELDVTLAFAIAGSDEE